MKRRLIATLGKQDSDGITPSVMAVIVSECGSEAVGFNTDSRVEARVISSRAPEHLHTDDVLVEEVPSPEHGFFDKETKEPAKDRRALEQLRSQDLSQLKPYFNRGEGPDLVAFGA